MENRKKQNFQVCGIYKEEKKGEDTMAILTARERRRKGEQRNKIE